MKLDKIPAGNRLIGKDLVGKEQGQLILQDLDAAIEDYISEHSEKDIHNFILSIRTGDKYTGNKDLEVISEILVNPQERLGFLYNRATKPASNGVAEYKHISYLEIRNYIAACINEKYDANLTEKEMQIYKNSNVKLVRPPEVIDREADAAAIEAAQAEAWPEAAEAAAAVPDVLNNEIAAAAAVPADDDLEAALAASAATIQPHYPEYDLEAALAASMAEAAKPQKEALYPELMLIKMQSGRCFDANCYKIATADGRLVPVTDYIGEGSLDDASDQVSQLMGENVMFVQGYYSDG